MKEKELRKHAQCGVCKKRIGHTGLPMFWTVRIERHGLKSDVIQRQDGLAALLGSSAIASVMGTDEEMTMPLMEPVTVTVCEPCAMMQVCIAQLALDSDKEKESDNKEGVNVA